MLLGSGSACLADETVHRLGWLGTDGEPFFSLREVDLVVRAFNQRIVSSDLFDITTIPTLAAIDGYDFVIGTIFGALAVET